MLGNFTFEKNVSERFKMGWAQGAMVVGRIIKIIIKRSFSMRKTTMKKEEIGLYPLLWAGNFPHVLPDWRPVEVKWEGLMPSNLILGNSCFNDHSSYGFSGKFRIGFPFDGYKRGPDFHKITEEHIYTNDLASSDIWGASEFGKRARVKAIFWKR